MTSDKHTEAGFVSATITTEQAAAARTRAAAVRRDMLQLNALERSATRVGSTETQATPIAVTDIVMVRGESRRAIAVKAIANNSGVEWAIAFKSGEIALIHASRLIRVAASLGE